MSFGTLVAEMCLEIGHQEGCRDCRLAANVADHQPKLIATEIEKIAIIATDVAGLDANSSVFWWWKEWVESRGKSLDWTCLASSNSWLKRCSDSDFRRERRRCVSTSRLIRRHKTKA